MDTQYNLKWRKPYTHDIYHWRHKMYYDYEININDILAGFVMLIQLYMYGFHVRVPV